MITFPNAKINIGLKITGKLPNGYHTLKSLMVPTPFCDILEFAPAQKDHLELHGINIPGKPENNLVFTVLNKLRNQFDIPPLGIHLYKNIPAGGGLGGGSADSAFFLNILNEYFQLGMSVKEREDFMAPVGSDCPFFIRNKPALITGTGTTLEPSDIKLDGLFLAIAVPGFQISTARAYAGVTPEAEHTPLEYLLKKDIRDWKHYIVNDFEQSLFPAYPELRELKESFYENGAYYASLSGSGSAVYGIFEKKPEFSSAMKKNLVFDNYFSAIKS